MQNLSEAIYTAGKVFNNLQSEHLATLNFLEKNDLSQISSKADLWLLNY